MKNMMLASIAGGFIVFIWGVLSHMVTLMGTAGLALAKVVPASSRASA